MGNGENKRFVICIYLWKYKPNGEGQRGKLHLSSGESSWEHLHWSVKVANFQNHYFIEMERCWICSLIWLNVFLVFQCLEAPANLGKVSPIIISCAGSLKFRALVLHFRRWKQPQRYEEIWKLNISVLDIDISIFVRFQVYIGSSVATMYHGG